MSDQCNDPYEFREDHQDITDNIFAQKANKCAKIAKDIKTITKMDVDAQEESTGHPQTYKTCSVAVETETAYLGPCEPGTSVTLEGVVWHESDTGILVINVNWRGKKYIGTLLDVSQHEWAPPNFNPNNTTAPCPVKEKSPIKLRSRKGRGGKRTAPVPPPVQRSPRKWTSVTTGITPVSSEPSRSSDDSTMTIESVVTCNRSNCNKRFKGANCQDALEYHTVHAHLGVPDSSLNDKKLIVDELKDKGNITTRQKDNKNVTPEKKIKNEPETKISNNANVKDDSKSNTVGQSDKISASMTRSSTNSVQPVDISVKQTEGKSIGFTSSNVVHSSHNMKKMNTPVAVLRPLVPQVSSSHDGKLSASSRNTQALNIPRLPPSRSINNVPNMPKSSQFFNSGQQLQHFVTSSNSMQVNQYPIIVPANQGAGSRNMTFYPPAMHVAAPVTSRALGGGADKIQGRNSLTYSDISDASDQEGEVVDNEVRGPATEGSTSRACSTIEDRLFCNEELATSSPPLNSTDPQNTVIQNQQSCTTTVSNTPGKSTTNITYKTPHGNNSINSVSTSNNCTQPQSHHILSTQQQPPQAMMYPYIPFMQNAQMQGSLPFQPPTGPVYASPYLMTYPGMPQFIQPAQQMGNMPNTNQQFQVMPVSSESHTPTSKNS